VGREALALQGWAPAAQAPALVALLVDMLLRPATAEAGVRAECARIASEARHTSGALDRAVPGHPLANPILGNAAALAALSPDLLRAWWAEHLIGQRVAAIAVGPWDAAALRAACASLGHLPASAHETNGAAPPARVPPAPAPSADPEEGHAGWVLPGPVLGGLGEPAFRLAERWAALALAQDAPPGGAVDSHIEFTTEQSLWTLALDASDAERARATEQRVSRLAQDGPDAAALDAVRAGFLAQLDLEADDPPGTMARLGEEWIVAGKVRERGALRSAFGVVTRDDVRTALRRALSRALPFGWPRPTGSPHP
jgi:hypothetical protein